ncbi:hypothetical protein [Arsenicibacter rosenii]|uniref:Uncharacterized protein n=1 Tax=Arsenicibacter rosenii TaxID=1750698 RepID=A0A1S2VPA3_9BACT|nr:hypothetical protein [Arsenicibacter rosenii]OIN60591.1 hypothetical protein BLX24_00230 [Arsenicibacter rosenii]
MFLILAILFFVLTWLFRGLVFDIQLADTYYVIPTFQIFLALGISCCLIEAAYFVRRKQVSRLRPKRDYQWHVVATTLCGLVFVYSQMQNLVLSGIDRRYVSIPDIEAMRTASYLGGLALLAFLVVQAAYLIRFSVVAVMRRG